MSSRPYCLTPRTPYLFSSLNVQRDMLRDNIRNERFRDAVFRAVRPGDTVIDLGTGTGILAIWAAKAGARQIFAIEETNIAAMAEEVISANGLDGVITVLHANSSEVVIPERADVLLAEVVGHFVFEEGIVESVAGVRDAWLKPDARLVPYRARVFVAPLGLGDAFEDVSFWSTLDGIDLSSIKAEAANSVYVETVPPDRVLGPASMAFDVDFRTVSPQTFRYEGMLHAERDGVLDAIGGWFEIDLAEDVSILTAPTAPPTHWKQCIFPLENPVHAGKGEAFRFTLEIEPFGAGSKWRWEIAAERGVRRERHVCRIMHAESILLNERF